MWNAHCEYYGSRITTIWKWHNTNFNSTKNLLLNMVVWHWPRQKTRASQVNESHCLSIFWKIEDAELADQSDSQKDDRICPGNTKTCRLRSRLTFQTCKAVNAASMNRKFNLRCTFLRKIPKTSSRSKKFSYKLLKFYIGNRRYGYNGQKYFRGK